MADQKLIDSLVEYYLNLLIIQYKDKPKAQAFIELNIRQILQDGIFLDVMAGFDPETAVGKQLDILGKWVGVDRYYTGSGGSQKLSDDDYRIVLNFKTICNAINMSPSDIDNALYAIFGDKIICSTDNDLTIYYFIEASILPLGSILKQKKVLPKPLCVGIGGIIENKKWLGLCSYDTYDNPIPGNVSGLANYENWLTKDGSVLQYEDVLVD